MARYRSSRCAMPTTGRHDASGNGAMNGKEAGTMTRSARLFVGILFALMLVPSTASAQSAISGLVTDTTGSVMPGVTVEATSPALIEKVRVVVTDGQGRYSVVDLRPGLYTV